MAYKQKGFSPFTKKPSIWEKMKNKASDAKEWVKSKSVNMSNVVGDPEFKKKMTSEFKADRLKAQKLSRDRFNIKQKSTAMQTFKDEYHKGPGSKKRSNETDAQFNRRYNDSKRHAQNYAEAKYKKQQAAKPAAGPKTKSQLAEEKANKKPVPFTKKKK